jgi:hypothetical protein
MPHKKTSPTSETPSNSITAYQNKHRYTSKHSRPISNGVHLNWALESQMRVPGIEQMRAKKKTGSPTDFLKWVLVNYSVAEEAAGRGKSSGNESSVSAVSRPLAAPGTTL